MAAFFLIVIGLFNAIFPRAGWYLSIGWKLRDAEPSDESLLISRITGIAACVIATIYLIHASMSPPHSARITAETNIRGGLLNPITSMSSPTTKFVMEDISKDRETAEEHEIKQLFLDATWVKPASNDGTQEGPHVKEEVELHLNNGYGLIIYWFCFGDAHFGIGRNSIDPEYVFTSEPLQHWLEAHKA